MPKKMLTLFCLALLLGVSCIHVVNGGRVAETVFRSVPLPQRHDSQQTVHFLSSSEGDMQWSQSYDGIEDDWGYAVIQTADGGFVFAGTTFNIETGDYDAWLVKTDANGDYQWDQIYGTYEDDKVYTAIQTVDGGYALAGTTYSGTSGLGGWDAWLVKIDANGDSQWNQIFGTYEDDKVHAAIQTVDGGYALAGITYDNETGDYDAWLGKTDANGDLLWDQIYGSYENDWAWTVIEAADNRYILAGTTFNNETGDYDAWLVKTDANGDYQWDQIYGTDEDDRVYTAIQTADRGFVLAGTTFNNETGDYDFWLLKVNASGDYQWDQIYGTNEDDKAYAVIQTPDGGYALAGYTDSSGLGKWDAWLVKTDASGEVEWTQTYGGAEDNWAEAVIETADGGYALAGTTFNNETGNYDFWLMKTVSPPESTTVPTSFVPGMMVFMGLAALTVLGVWRKRR